MMLKTLLLTVVFLSLAHPAYAYLDPGTGSYIAQVVIASIAGAGYLLFSARDRIGNFLKGLSSRIKKPKSDEDAK